jgi:hypothetical protein
MKRETSGRALGKRAVVGRRGSSTVLHRTPLVRREATVQEQRMLRFHHVWCDVIWVALDGDFRSFGLSCSLELP